MHVVTVSLKAEDGKLITTPTRTFKILTDLAGEAPAVVTATLQASSSPQSRYVPTTAGANSGSGPPSAFDGQTLSENFSQSWGNIAGSSASVQGVPDGEVGVSPRRPGNRGRPFPSCPPRLAARYIGIPRSGTPRRRPRTGGGIRDS